jgi:hypothetical protein
VPLHGDQESSQFRGDDDHDRYLPLYVFAGSAMLACVLRPSRIDGARLHRQVAAWEEELEAAFRRDGTKQRMIREFRYAADSWNIERRVVTRLEYGNQGTNPRFVVTNLDHPPPRISTTSATVSAAKPRTGSRRRSSISSARVPVATGSLPTGCAGCLPHWPAR